MTTIEKIKAEIERLIEESDFDESANLYSLLSFLSTLDSEKPAPNDLEEAANNHIREVVDAAGHPGWEWTTQDIADAFIAGAEWQKQEMLKEAVEAMVTTNLANRPVIYLDQLKGFQYGDKVRIIILKQE